MMADKLLPCPFCGGEAAIEQTGPKELTLRCVGTQPSGLRGCGPKFVQRVKTHSLEWLSGIMAERWNNRHDQSDARDRLIGNLLDRWEMTPNDLKEEMREHGCGKQLDALLVASDLLAERIYGSPARSPAHNARVVMERALNQGASDA